VSLNYIKKMDQLCKRNKVAFVLINTPVYHAKEYADMEQFEATRKKYLGDLLYIDYTDFSLPDSSRFDISHLNKKGAGEFSMYLSKNLAAGINR
jgi:hypothetical protein